MPKSIDLIGQKKYSLTVVAKADKDAKFNRIMWSCLCECGNTTKVCTGDWNAGRAKSCGCYKNRKGSDHPNWRHGLTKTNEYQYRIRLKRRYGISADQYDEMLAKQSWKCAICSVDQGSSKGHALAVDHCHKSGLVRGLLCNTCNRAIGMLHDDPDLLIKAAKYLKGVSNVSSK